MPKRGSSGDSAPRRAPQARAGLSAGLRPPRQSAPHPLGRDWEGVDARATRFLHRVRDSRGYTGIHQFAGRTCAIRADTVAVREMHDAEGWHVGDGRKLVVAEVRGAHASLLEREILGQCHPEAIDESSLELPA